MFQKIKPVPLASFNITGSVNGLVFLLKTQSHSSLENVKKF